jgi:flagellin
MISIQTNVNSLIAQQNLSVNSAFQSKTIAQLTSGYRINQSGDDAAGLAVANKFRSGGAELTQGVANGNDATAQLQIMDGGMSNISQILDRLKTLATQSASGTFTGSRDTVDAEFQNDLAEIDRQAQSIGLNTGGAFNKNLDVYLGTGSGSTTLQNGIVTLGLTQSAVDSQALGMKGMEAVNLTSGDLSGTTAGVDIGTTSPTSVQAIVGNTGGGIYANQEATAGYASMQFSGAGFSDAGKVGISVNLAGVTDVATLVAAVNSAIGAAGNGTTSAATQFKNANIVASVHTDSGGGQQLAFSSSTAAFQVQAGDQMGNALLGNVSIVDPTVSKVAQGTAVASTTATKVTGAPTDATNAAFTPGQFVKLVVNGGGLASPVTLTLADTGITVHTAGAITDLETQFAGNAALQAAGLSMTGAAGGALVFNSASGQAFNVQMSGDTSGLLGLGTFSTDTTGNADYSTIQGAAYSQAGVLAHAATSGAQASTTMDAATLDTASGVPANFNGKTLTLNVDGAAQSIALAGSGNTTGAGILADLQTKLATVGATAAFDGNTGLLTIASAGTGSTSSIQITGGTGMAALGLTAAIAATKGTDLTSADMEISLNGAASVGLAPIDLTAGAHATAATATGTALNVVTTPIAFTGGAGDTISIDSSGAASPFATNLVTLTATQAATSGAVVGTGTAAGTGVNDIAYTAHNMDDVAFDVNVNGTGTHAVTLAPANNPATAGETVGLASSGITYGAGLNGVTFSVKVDGNTNPTQVVTLAPTVVAATAATSAGSASGGITYGAGLDGVSFSVTTDIGTAAISLAPTVTAATSGIVTGTIANSTSNYYTDAAAGGPLVVTVNGTSRTIALTPVVTPAKPSALVGADWATINAAGVTKTAFNVTTDTTSITSLTLGTSFTTGTGNQAAFLVDLNTQLATVGANAYFDAGNGGKLTVVSNTLGMSSSIVISSSGDTTAMGIVGTGTGKADASTNTVTDAASLLTRLNGTLGQYGAHAFFDASNMLNIESNATGAGTAANIQVAASTAATKLGLDTSNHAGADAITTHISNGAQLLSALNTQLGADGQAYFDAANGGKLTIASKTVGTGSTTSLGSAVALLGLASGAGTAAILASTTNITTQAQLLANINSQLTGANAYFDSANGGKLTIASTGTPGVGSEVNVTANDGGVALTKLGIAIADNVGAAAGSVTNDTQLLASLNKQLGLLGANAFFDASNGNKLTIASNTSGTTSSIAITAMAGTGSIGIVNTSAKLGANATASLADIAGQIQTQLGANAVVSVVGSGNELQIASAGKGSGQTFLINTAGTVGAGALLGLTTGATAYTGKSSSTQDIVDNLNAQFSTNANLVNASLKASLNGSNQITIASANGTQFRLNALAGTSPTNTGGADAGFGNTGVAFTGASSNSTSMSTLNAYGISNSGAFTFSALAFGSDKQALTFSATDAKGVLETGTITLQNNTAANSNRAGASIDAAVAYINQQLQRTTSNPALQSIVAVKQVVSGAEQINFVSSLSKFTVGVAATATGDGLNSNMPTPQATQKVSASYGSGANMSVETQAGAEAAVTAIAAAVAKLGSAQAAVGKGENELGYAVSLASSQITNFSAAESQIRDANVAQQAANLSKAQVLSQASIAAMAQANSAPQAVLSLLRG